jgi:hypothetical protein
MRASKKPILKNIIKYLKDKRYRFVLKIKKVFQIDKIIK